MKKLTSTLALCTALAAPAYADLIYSVPGMEEAKSTGNKTGWGTDYQPNEVLGRYTEYRITGVSWSIPAGQPVTAKGTKGNGDFKPASKWDPASAIGKITSFYMQIGGKQVVSMSDLSRTSFTNINQVSSGTKDFSSNPIVLTDQDLHFSGNLVSNMKDTGTVYLQIHGVALKNAPAPYGELEVTAFVREGAKPTVKWTIGRDGTTGTESEGSVSTPVTPTSTPGDTTTNPTSSEPNESGTCQPATNCAKVKSNNGHGNNIDGVDVSNPGKSGQKWHDPSGSIDDEGKGGGSAASYTSGGGCKGPSWK